MHFGQFSQVGEQKEHTQVTWLLVISEVQQEGKGTAWCRIDDCQLSKMPQFKASSLTC